MNWQVEKFCFQFTKETLEVDINLRQALTKYPVSNNDDDNDNACTG